MNELILRLKAIIGSLKLFAVAVLILAAIVLYAGFGNLSTALKNPTGEPQPVTVEQLVDGTVGTGQYVSVRGYAMFDAGYEKTEDGDVVATYYFLLDYDTGHLIVVKADTKTTSGRVPKETTITGVTRKPESMLKSKLQDDTDIKEAGFETNPGLYISEGATPPATATGATMVVGGGVVALLCIATFFFPGTVFAPAPLPAVAPSAADQAKPGVKATGLFQQIQKMQPSIEVGKKTRKFTNAVANVYPLTEQRLMIYIHHIVKSRYGRVISRTDWGAFLEPSNTTDVEAGKVYGWKNRWAVRFSYTGPKEKPETLIVSFDKDWGQVGFVNTLKKMGFTTY